MVLLFLAGTISTYTSALRVCEPIADSVQQTCRPLALTDLPVVLVLLVVAALVAPYVKKLSIPGVVDVEPSDKVDPDEDLGKEEEKVEKKGADFLSFVQQWVERERGGA